jgi:putative glutamine amidotransferase
MPEPRPLIAIPARFSESASALRYRAEVVAAALAESVYAAGGEPLVVHPGPEDDPDVVIAERLRWADGVLLPGGGDLSPHWAGQSAHPSLYDVDVRQDAFDLGIARVVLASDLPLLAICRGLQVVNVVLGGDVVQDMDESVGHHRHRRHHLELDTGSATAAIVGGRLEVSCYHHQCLGRLGDGLRVVGVAEDGVVEAVELPGRAGWFAGTQWHPEDTALTDPAQLRLFEAFVDAARVRRGAAAAWTTSA